MAGTLRVGYRAGHRQDVLARSYRRKTETDLGAVSTEIKRHDYTNSRELSYKMMRWGRAVLCTPFIARLRAARTHSTSLRAGCDAPYLLSPSAVSSHRLAERFDLIFLVRRGYSNTQTRGTLRHGWITNRRHKESFAFE